MHGRDDDARPRTDGMNQDTRQRPRRPDLAQGLPPPALLIAARRGGRRGSPGAESWPIPPSLGHCGGAVARAGHRSARPRRVLHHHSSPCPKPCSATWSAAGSASLCGGDLPDRKSGGRAAAVRCVPEPAESRGGADHRALARLGLASKVADRRATDVLPGADHGLGRIPGGSGGRTHELLRSLSATPKIFWVKVKF